jgi:hypothetical protein
LRDLLTLQLWERPLLQIALLRLGRLLRNWLAP